MVAKLREYYELYNRWPSAYKANPREAKIAEFRAYQIVRHGKKLKSENGLIKNTVQQMTDKQLSALLSINEHVLAKGTYKERPSGTCLLA